MKALGHFKTITQHKILVMKYCFRVGLYHQGIMHDMSKYSPQEFRIGAKYYTGTHSPNAAERGDLGYSTAWLHHKGRNKHHLEYWMDYGHNTPGLAGQPMPTKYMVELCLDRIAACRVYHGDQYTDRDPLEYLNHSRDANLMHPDTKRQVVEVLTMLAEEGEERTLSFLKRLVHEEPVKLYKNLPLPEPDPAEKDQTFCGQETLRTAAEEINTPFYLYSEERVRSACKEVDEAFAWNGKHRQFFPVKATPTPAVLRIIKSCGHGVVCSSATELELCRRCGFTAQDIMFLPNYPRKEDMEKAAEVGCGVTLDSGDLVGEFAGYSLLSGIVGLRINPGGVLRFGNGEAKLDGMKFGISPEKAIETVLRLKEYGVAKIGLHAYISGNTMETEYYPAVASVLAKLALRIHRETGMEVSYLNISGGPGIPYRPRQNAFDLKTSGCRVNEVFREILTGTPLENIAVYTEIGRYITGPAGILVTKVNHIKKDFRNIAGVDASAADLMRPMMYGAYHHISVVSDEDRGERTPWDVVGAVCENTDKFGEGRMLPELKKGDILLIHDAGAHGHSMGYRYGGRLRCGEYLLHGDGTIEMIRRAETTEDHFDTLIF